MLFFRYVLLNRYGLGSGGLAVIATVYLLTLYKSQTNNSKKLVQYN